MKIVNVIAVCFFTAGIFLLGFIFGMAYQQKADHADWQGVMTLDPTTDGVDSEVAVYPPPGKAYVTLRRKRFPIGEFEVVIGKIITNNVDIPSGVFPFPTPETPVVTIQPFGQPMGYIDNPPAR